MSEPATEEVIAVPKTSPAAEATERPREAVTGPVKQDVQTQASPHGEADRRPETAHKEEKTIEKPPALVTKKMSYSASGVVSRDREALARLLTSF